MTQKRILIADDDPAVLKITAARLQHEGFAVTAVADGESALATVGRWAPDLILLDIRMPRLDGFEVCHRLKADPATAGLPAIIFTASESHVRHLADRCLELGVADWLRKPYRSKDLLEKITRVLG